MNVSHYNIYYELKAVECQKYYTIKQLGKQFSVLHNKNTRKITYTSAPSVKQFTKIILMVGCI